MSLSFIPISADAISGIAGSDVRLAYDNNILLDSAVLYGAGANDLMDRSFDRPVYFFGPRMPLTFEKDAEYTVEFNATCRKNTIDFDARMDIFFVGDAFPSIDPLGEQIHIMKCKVGTEFQPFGRVRVNFKAKRSGTARLRYLVYGGLWYVSDVSVKLAEEFGYTPNESSILAPIISYRKEAIQFKIDLYDANNNILPINLETIPVYFNGGNLVIRGEDNKITGKITVTGDEIVSGSSGIVITAMGYTGSDGIPVPSASAMYIGAGKHKDINTPFFVGQTPSGSPLFSLGDKFFAEEIDGNYNISISGSVGTSFKVGNNLLYDGDRLLLNDPDIILNNLPVAHGMKSGIAEFGIKETFTGNPFENPPQITFGSLGVSFHPSLINQSHGPIVDALDVDVSGFTPYMAMRVDVTSSVGQTGSFAGDTYKKSTSTEAFDRRYTYVFDVNMNVPTGSLPISSTKIYLYSGNSPLSAPTLRAVRTYTNTSGSSVSYMDQKVTLALTSMNSGSYFKVVVGEQQGSGGSVTPKRIEWKTATNVVELPLTGSSVSYTAVVGT